MHPLLPLVFIFTIGSHLIQMKGPLNADNFGIFKKQQWRGLPLKKNEPKANLIQQGVNRILSKLIGAQNLKFVDIYSSLHVKCEISDLTLSE